MFQVHIPAVPKSLHLPLTLEHTGDSPDEEKHTEQLLSGHKMSTQHATEVHRMAELQTHFV